MCLARLTRSEYKGRLGTLKHALLAFVLLTPASLSAQAAPEEADASGAEPADAGGVDEEARSVFRAGETAFNGARYADALAHFRRAHELSGRPELLYNIGVAADRLRRDEEALAAFEQFVAEVADHPRLRDAHARIEVLRAQIAGRPGDAAPSGGDVTPHVIGSAALAVGGLAGVVAAIVGMAAPAGCLESDGLGCIEEEVTSWTGVGVYGGLGLAALVGATVWLIVGLSGGSEERAAASRAVAQGWAF